MDDIGPKSIQTRVVGIITNEMHPYIQFSSNRVSMKMCRGASYLLYHPNYLRNKHSQQERLECTRVPWLIHWEFPSSFQV